jgi:NAD(P)-dependent dehydrogenase (short-subunit alcohol dehydrogenase family)
MKILVTGGASGLGEAITRELAKDKSSAVYFTFNSSLEQARKIEQEYENTHAIVCDFSKESNMKSLMEKIIEIDLDVLINNAWTGVQLTHFHKQNSTDFQKTFQLNILPTLQITQQAISIFRKKKSGKIITVLTSDLIDNPPVGASDYIAAKAYLASMTKSWACENVRFNITSNAVSPSVMPTNIHSMDERLMEELIKNHPLKKLLSTNETADAVKYFVYCSSHINGANLIINAASHVI